MSDIFIQRSHGVNLEQACALIAQLADKVSESLGATPQWRDQQCVAFQQMGASGEMYCDLEQLTVKIDLGFLFKGMQASVEQKIHAQLDKLLG